jgi:arginyl-tRNA synthetase
MKDEIAKLISKQIPLRSEEILNLLEAPPTPDLGDYAFPCFSLAKILKKNPVEIAKELARDLSPNKDFEKIQATGPYVNFFVDKKSFSLEILKKIQKEKNKFG